MTERTLVTSPYVPDTGAVRKWLEDMIKSGKLIELVIAIVALITRMRDINTELMKRLAHLHRKRPKSETLERVQRQMAFAFAGQAGSAAKPKPESSDDSPGKAKRSRRGRHPGRGGLPAQLERIPVLNPVPPEQRICPICGSEMKTVGHSTCEILELIPARLVVHQRMDERVACPHDDAIVSAPTPPQIVVRGVLGTTLILEALCEKYLEYTPIERQCQRWARAGVDIAPQTLARSVGAAIDLLTPLATLIVKEVRGPGILATDSTLLPVLDPSVPEGIRAGAMWCWMNARWVAFFYSPSGDAASVKRFLGDELARTVQCDGTSVTNFIERAGGKRPGCWSHGRRRFVEAARGGDALALEGLEKIAPLFGVEAESLLAGDTVEQRQARRGEKSKPILDDIRAWVDQHRPLIPPKTPLGRALRYVHRQWQRLCLFLEDGRIELTNNRRERELRRLVQGRKNWLFTWLDVGGERTAAILTIIGSCIAHDINPRAYLHLVTKLILDGWPNSKLRELLPDRIGRSHPHLRIVDEALLPHLTEPAALPPPT